MDKKFYRVGEKIYENGTNRYIDMPEWQKDWSGKATEVASPEAQKKLEQEENIMGRPSTQPEIGKMYPEYASEYGTDSSNLGALGQEKEATAQGVKSLGQPTYAINLLQEAIKKKQGTANKGIGKSPIFEKAGLTGIGSLASSLASRQGEIRDNRAYFSNIIGEAMGGYKDMMNQANFAYEAAASEYEQEMERLTDIDEELRKHKRAIELYEKKAEIDKNLAIWEADQNKTPITNVGGYDISSYATDPNHETAVQNIMDYIGKFNTIEDVDTYIQQVASGSPVTGDMISKASEKYGVDWEMMVAMMQQDSSLGTKGMGARNNNPFNIGQFDNLNSPVEGYKTMQDGVNAGAEWLSKHKNNEETQNIPEDGVYNEDTKLEVKINSAQKNKLIGLGIPANGVNQLLLNVQTSGLEDTKNQIILENGETEEVQAILDALDDIFLQ